jgi:uncharacterized SAM-binding protein YcdF (DUF218 family)
LAILACLITAFAALGVRLYVYPQIDQLRRADAILILSGPHHDRYPFGLELAEQGWAPNLVISNPSGAGDRWVTRVCAAPHPKFTVHCFAPDPATTKGEGRELRRLAAQYGWHTVIVVTFRPHVSRARYILEQCFDGDLVMVASPTPVSTLRWSFEFLYQSAGYARSLLQPGC